MKEIIRDGATIHYTVTGHGDITLLFVHGSYIDETYWKEQVAFFNESYTVVTLDLAGHGQSGENRAHWSVQGFAEDVMTVIGTLQLENVIYIGHSLAGEIGLMVSTSLKPPLLGLIAVDILKNAAQPLPPEFEQQAAGIEAQLKKDFANTNEQYARMALLTGKTPAFISDRVVNAYRTALPAMGVATTPEIFTMYKIEKALLPVLPLKLYLINVDYMPTNENALQQAAVNGYTLKHIEGTCHFPMLENPDEVNKLLQECINEIGRPVDK